MKADAVDLFAGPGGWDLPATHALGLDVIGVENDASTVATRRAAGFRTMASDILNVDPFLFRDVPGLIASPPCQTFSQAGSGSGRRQLDLVARAIKRMSAGEWPADEVAETHDPRTALVLQPLRWALVMRPRWIAFEQVPTVLPVWQAMGDVLDQEGYSVATGYLYAEQYGVPQTRKRAILIARDDRLVAMPTPTHSRYHVRTPTRLDPNVLPWVTMADALGVGLSDRPSPTITGGGTDTGGAEPIAHFERYVRRASWQMASGTREKSATRNGNQPSPTMAFGHNRSSFVWTPAGMPSTDVPEWKAGGSEGWTPDFNDQTGTPFDHEWPMKRPATVVAGREIVQNPGASANRFNGATKSRNDGVRVSVEEAAALQSFPPDFPWQGNKTAQYRQIGNAIPPLLAYAVLRAVAGQ